MIDAYATPQASTADLSAMLIRCGLYPKSTSCPGGLMSYLRPFTLGFLTLKISAKFQLHRPKQGLTIHCPHHIARSQLL